MFSRKTKSAADLSMLTYPDQQSVNLYTFVIMTISIVGIIGFVASDNSVSLLVALICVSLVVFYRYYQEQKHRKQAIDLLHQLATEILDTGVIIFDMHERDISCRVWAPNDPEALTCKVHSSNTKYDSIRLSTLILKEHNSINLAIRERSQIFETRKLTTTTQGTIGEQISITRLDSFERLKSHWDWRLVTPVIDAIDRLNVIGIVVIEGDGECQVDELNKLGLDRAAAMLSYQISEVISVMRRL